MDHFSRSVTPVCCIHLLLLFIVVVVVVVVGILVVVIGVYLKCFNVMFWPFDPAKNAIQGDAPEESDTF